MRNDIIKGHLTPEALGIRSRDVLQCLKEMDASVNEIHGFAAARHGYVFAETYLTPYAGNLPHNCHSLGKSYTCTAVGVACQEGLLSPEDRVVDIFAEEIRQWGIRPNEAFQGLRLRHLMSMSVGMERMPALDEHWMENFLREPVKVTPGTEFLYNSTGSCMLGAAVEKVTGMDMETYLRTKLLEKIGIEKEDLVWRKFENGRSAEPGISATTSSNLRLGLFYLAEGNVNGRQIVSKEWMKEAMSRQVDDGDGKRTNDQNSGYGWQLWLCHPDTMFRFDGGQGQFCLVDRERDIAVAFHQGGWHPTGAYEMLVKVKNLIQKAAEKPLPEDPEAYQELTDYMEARRIPMPEVRPVPEKAYAMNGVYRVEEGRLNPWIEVAPDAGDFYHLFYDPSFKPSIEVFSIDVKGDRVIFNWNQKSRMVARLDGRWERSDTVTPLGDLTAYAATAYFKDENTMHVTIKWLNGWSTPEIDIRRTGPAALSITVAKDMLHEESAPHIANSSARRVR